MNPLRHEGEVAERQTAPCPGGPTTKAGALANSTIAKPNDARWRPLLDEVEQATGRHDVYYCPTTSDEDEP